jgi:hypothetical protein
LFYGETTGDLREVHGSQAQNEMYGEYVCHRGMATNYSCGTVTDSYYKPVYSGACQAYTCNYEFVKIEGPGLACYPGDSGGPVFQGLIAYGFDKGGSWTNMGGPGDCSWAIFTPVRKVNSMNVSLFVHP